MYFPILKEAPDILDGTELARYASPLPADPDSFVNGKIYEVSDNQ